MLNKTDPTEVHRKTWAHNYKHYCRNCDKPESICGTICAYCGCYIASQPQTQMVIRSPKFYSPPAPPPPPIPLDPSSPPALDPEFHRFNDLPIELRLRIWEEALPGPRVVYLELCRLKWHEFSRVRSDMTQEMADATEVLEGIVTKKNIAPARYGFKSDSTITLLYVCRESYEVACKRYTRSFGNEWAFPETWFDEEQDTLYLDMGYSCNFKYGKKYSMEELPNDIETVERLATFYADRLFLGTPLSRNYPLFLHHLFTKFPNLLMHMRALIRYGEQTDTTDLVSMCTVSLDQLMGYNKKIATPESNFELVIAGHEYLVKCAHLFVALPQEIAKHRDKKSNLGEDGLPLYSIPPLYTSLLTPRYIKESVAELQSAIKKSKITVQLKHKNHPPISLKIDSGDTLNWAAEVFKDKVGLCEEDIVQFFYGRNGRKPLNMEDSFGRVPFKNLKEPQVLRVQIVTVADQLDQV